MSVLSNSHSTPLEENHDAESITGSRKSSQHTASASRSPSSSPEMEAHIVLSESSEKDEENTMKSPFTIPPDADIFAIRNKEIKKAKAERERMKTLKVHEKTTYSTKIKEKGGLRKALEKEEEEEGTKQATSEERLKALQEILSWKLAMRKDYTLEKETFCGYINDRREIFFLEYTMAVKQEEIKKMENIAKNEEKKLEKAEKKLEKDAAMFDEFLKENKNNSVKALKVAKEETSAKIKKQREIQAITSQIRKVQSDISRLEDTLQEYKMYRDILYHLAPKEWQKEHPKKHTKQKDLRTGSEDQGLTARTSTAHRASYTDLPRSLLYSGSLDFSSHGIRPQLQHFLKPLLTTEPSSLKDAESEISSDEDEEPELYFTHPEQLLTAFMRMQEENISFMQNCQDTEESWNKVQHTFITTHETMEKELAELKQQVNTLQSSVAKEEERVADLKLKVHLLSSEEHKADDEDKMLASLHKKVLEVYSHCTGDNETNLQTVEMLKVIEKQLNDLLDNLERIPASKIEKAEKALRKEKMKRLREEKIKQKQQQVEVWERDMERSQATVEKKNNGRLAFHSNPPAKKKNQEQIDKEKEEQAYYFS